MANPFYIAEEIDEEIRRLTGPLAGLLRGMPGLVALDDVQIEHVSYTGHRSIKFTFADGNRWNCARLCRLPRESYPDLCRACRSLYSRLYEDELLRRQLEPMRQALRAMERAGFQPHQLAEHRDALAERERHLRRHHRHDDEAMYTWGVDPAAPGADRATVSISARGMQVDFIAYDEFDSVTAEQQRAITAITERFRIDIEGAFRVSECYLGDSYAKAEAKGLALLKAWLSREQLAQYESQQSFDVIGGTTGKRYRIHHGRQQNIAELDKSGRRVCGWCFLPEGQLVAGDVMLAQKIALETNEKAALKVANKFGDRRYGRSPGDVSRLPTAGELRALTYGGGRRQGRTVMDELAVFGSAVVSVDPTS